MVSIVDRLRQRSQASFFGREQELQAFRRSLDLDPAPVSVFLLHGPGGMGKTALLEQMVSQARQAGFACIRLDGRHLEPSPHGILLGLATALGLPLSQAQLAHILPAWRTQPRRLLAIDTFEHLSHLTPWLRDQLLAELPQQSLAIIAGRQAPDELWHDDPTWRHGSQSINLRNLSAPACDLALRAKGLPESQRQAIARLSHGHPLTLMLLADLVEAEGEVPRTLGTDVIRRLTECFAAQAPSSLHRQALEYCAHARVTTEDLLAATVDPEAAPALFDWLASLNFMELAPDGIFPHDLVRDAITAEMRWRTPQRVKDGASKLLRHYLSSAHPQASLDIFFLNRGHPVMRGFVDFAALGTVNCERAASEDQPAIARLVRHELGPEHAALVNRWHDHENATWWVVRDSQGEVAAAMLVLELSQLPPRAHADDPALAQLRQWVDDQAPLRPGEKVLWARLAVFRGTLPNPEPFINAVQLRTFSMWMSEPALALFAMTHRDPDHWRPMMRHLNFHPIHVPHFDMDGQRHGTFAHDWRAVPLTQWLASIGGSQANKTPPAPAPAPLSEHDFRTALHEALRQWHDPVLLGRNPLMGSRLLRLERQAAEDNHEALRRLIVATADVLSAHPRQLRFIRTIDLTYWRPAGSQELAAERLGLPFGTYRYQLRTAIERLGSALWLRENDEPD